MDTRTTLTFFVGFELVDQDDYTGKYWEEPPVQENWFEPSLPFCRLYYTSCIRSSDGSLLEERNDEARTTLDINRDQVRLEVPDYDVKHYKMFGGPGIRVITQQSLVEFMREKGYTGSTSDKRYIEFLVNDYVEKWNNRRS